MRHFCFMHNVTWKPKENATPWKLRHGEDFPADLHPFGSKVFYTPATTKANGAEHKFSPSSVAGIIIGYHINPGGVLSKDYFVLNLETAMNSDCTKYMPTLRVGQVYREKGPPVFPLKRVETDDQTHCTEAAQSSAERKHGHDLDDPNIDSNGKYKPGSHVPKDKFNPAFVPKGYEWQLERITKVRTTQRTPDILPEVWNVMSKKQRLSLIHI